MKKYNRNLFVKMTDEERQRIDELASFYDMTASDFIRRMVVYVDEVRPRITIEPKREMAR